MWLFVVHTAAIVLGAAAGLVLGRLRRRVWLSAAVTAAVLAFARGVLTWRPDLVSAAVPWTDYALIEDWHVPLVVLGLTLLVRHLPRRQTRRLVWVAGLVAAAYGVWAAGATFLVSFNDLTGAPDGAGLCRQTSRYSCGAAVMCTVLARLGVATDEREMAQLSATQRHGGVSELGLRRAAAIKLRGRPCRARVARMTWERLAQLDAPCVITVRYSLWADHYVVVLGTDGDRVTVYDPLMPRPEVWNRRELEARWRRLAVVVERPGATAVSPSRPRQP